MLQSEIPSTYIPSTGASFKYNALVGHTLIFLRGFLFVIMVMNHTPVVGDKSERDIKNASAVALSPSASRERKSPARARICACIHTGNDGSMSRIQR